MIVKKIKFESDYNIDGIKDLYKTCMLHASLKNDFGLFCTGAALILRSVFNQDRGIKRGEKIDFDTANTVITTANLLDGFEGVKRDLIIAEMDEKNENELLSEKILVITKQVLKDKDEKNKC